MILRKFIHQKLSTYFSQPSKSVVGNIKDKEINFSRLLNSWHWQRTYQKVLDQQDGQWITPSELFRPHFSNIISNVIAHDVYKQDKSDDDIHIFELGAGRGTNANLILSHLKEKHQSIYSRITYYLIDSSPTLHDHQKDLMLNDTHYDKVKLVLDDLMNISTGDSKFFGKKSNIITYTLAFEVLDNLPHDKIIRCKDTGSILQAEVFFDGTKFQEKYQALTDPLLKTIVSIFPKQYCTSVRWVPSVAYSLLLQLITHRPNSRVIVADFDYLPPPDLTKPQSSALAFHAGGPLITDMDKLDHGCYLSAPPYCDVLFPTDFKSLTYFTKKLLCYNESVDIGFRKQADFFLECGSDEVDRTRNFFGYTPLLDDFSNCSVFTVLGK